MPSGVKKKTTYAKEVAFGFIVTAAVLGSAMLAAFNGGFSLEAGGLLMTLDASLTNGMQLSFVSV